MNDNWGHQVSRGDFVSLHHFEKVLEVKLGEGDDCIATVETKAENESQSIAVVKGQNTGPCVIGSWRALGLCYLQ